MNFTSDTFRQFCREMNIEQAITLAYHHQSNSQVEECMRFVKYTIKNALILIMSESSLITGKINANGFRIAQSCHTVIQ